jgi:hypothetical protein
VVGGGFCIAIGILDQSAVDNYNDINMSSIPSPPPLVMPFSCLGLAVAGALMLTLFGCCQKIGPADIVLVAMAEAARSSPRPHAQARFPTAGGCNGDNGGHCNDVHRLRPSLPHPIISSPLRVCQRLIILCTVQEYFWHA